MSAEGQIGQISLLILLCNSQEPGYLEASADSAPFPLVLRHLQMPRSHILSGTLCALGPKIIYNFPVISIKKVWDMYYRMSQKMYTV